jgi:hypothetical protein
MLFPRGFKNSEALSINFNFNYFGKSYSKLIIYTGGFVFFGTSFTAFKGNYMSVLSCDLDTRTSGGIYYQNLNSQSVDFNSIKSDLNRSNPTFVPTNLFRITYDNVPIKDKSSLLSSFQIVLASDSTKSYVLFKFIKCSYDVLYSATELFYLSSNLQQMSKRVSFNPCTETNVNLPGTWVLDVTSLNGKRFLSIFTLIYF